MDDVDRIASSIVALPEVVATLLADYPDDQLRRAPAPGEWSVLEVLAHLVEADGPAFRDRITSIARGDGTVPGYRPADPAPVAELTLAGLVDDLRAERAGSAALLRSLTETELRATGPHVDGRVFAAADFVREWPYHDADHLQQILSALKVLHVEGMSDTMRSALGES